MDLQLVVGSYRSFSPDAVLGMGGFTSTGPILSRSDGRSADVHSRIERYPGESQPAECVAFEKGAAGFEECARCFPNVAIEVTGTPIRNSLKRPVDRSQALDNLRLKSGLADRTGDGREPGSAWNKPSGSGGS